MNDMTLLSFLAQSKVFSNRSNYLAHGPNQSNAWQEMGFLKVSKKSRIHILLRVQNHNPDVYRFKMEVSSWDKVSYFNKISDSDT